MFKGIITPIITPFNRDEPQTINYAAMEEHVNHLIKRGVDGIFILGSNGEFHVINQKEKLELAKSVIKVVDKRVPVFVGTGLCSTQETITLSQRMEALGADALSVITPYFIKPSDEELYQHFKAVAESVTIPIVLYNIPKATGCPISKEVLKRLTEVKNIHAIKDSSGDMENLKDYIEVTTNTSVSVLVGSDSKISEAYKLGATGAIAGTSNLITEVIVNLYKALYAKDYDRANILQKDVDVLRALLPLGTVPSIIKRSIELAHITMAGPARRPVAETTYETDQKIIEMLRHYQLI